MSLKRHFARQVAKIAEEPEFSGRPTVSVHAGMLAEVMTGNPLKERGMDHDASPNATL
ncbi:MAG: hypothetical protein KDF62_14330 [Nitrosomonas sp.]|nr:hypothetical protein [Nitrosomonas sp.]